MTQSGAVPVNQSDMILTISKDWICWCNCGYTAFDDTYFKGYYGSIKGQGQCWIFNVHGRFDYAFCSTSC